ncbi:MAG: hypothetical protein BGO69_06670 [Bacteroidetes bacterium 46-16]|nr:MAG: hypothetical protein BGO69_06670 [Bacteroidetes bacterium 46-16]
MSDKQIFTKSKAIELANSLSKHIGETYNNQKIYDITIWPLDKVTQVGNRIANVYFELVHNTLKHTKADIANMLDDFEEEEEFDVKAILISRNAVSNLFFTIECKSVQDLPFY